MVFEIKFINDTNELDVETPEIDIAQLRRRILRDGKFMTVKAIVPFNGKPINDIIINTDNIKDIKLVGKRFVTKKISDKVSEAHIE